MSWFEVETKIKVNNPSEIREKIKKIAALTKKETRKDEYFALTKKHYPKKAFRIRFDGKAYIANFKKFQKSTSDKDVVVKEEFEFKLLGKEHLNNFIALQEDLNFKKWIDKTKICESYKLKKDEKIIIELNNVKRLGYFIEIEYLCHKNEISKAKSKIREVIKKLEIKNREIDNTGYTKMLYKKFKTA